MSSLLRVRVAEVNELKVGPATVVGPTAMENHHV